MGGAGGQRPRPAQEIVAYPEGIRVGERAAGMAQRVAWLAAGGGGERFHDADQRLVLGILADPQVPKSRQYFFGGLDIPAQRRQPSPAAEIGRASCRER